MALSRSPLERCVVHLLLRGNLNSFKTGDPIVVGSALIGDTLWPMDKGTAIPSKTLEDGVTQWVREHDPAAARFITLNTIIAAFEDFVGKIKVDRPKSRGTGNRKQLPSVRTLPARQDAIIQAWRRGMLTDTEFESVLDPGLRPSRRFVDRTSGTDEPTKRSTQDLWDDGLSEVDRLVEDEVERWSREDDCVS